MDSVTNIIRKLAAKEADLTKVSFKTPGTVDFDFYWFNKDNNPKSIYWQLTGVTNLKIVSSPKQHYVRVQAYTITKNNDLYDLVLKFESDTQISVTFAQIKAVVN